MDRAYPHRAIGRLVIVAFLLALAPLAAASQGVGVQPQPGGAAPAEVINQVPIRIEAGGNANYTDSDGNLWVADTGFTNGSTVNRGNIAIANTNNDRIYQTERYSVSGYAFTVANGNYAVRLHFAETYDGITGAGQRVFSVNVEGMLISNIDIYAEAGGRDIALVKTVNVTVSDGQLTIGFLSSVFNTEINGIEIIPGGSTIQRIEAGGSTDYTDSADNLWTADAGYIGGRTKDYGNIAIANTSDDRIHQTERYGMTGYTFPIADGNYTVRLHFTETFVNITAPGQRVFGVRVEGVSLGNIDIYAETGGRDIAMVKTVSVTVLDEQLDITFTQVVQNTKINGIEIIPVAPVPGEAALESLQVRNGAGQVQSSFLPGDQINLLMSGTVEGTSAASVDLRWIVKNAGGSVIAQLGGAETAVSIAPGPWSRSITRTLPASLAPGQYTFVGELEQDPPVQRLETSFTVASVAVPSLDSLSIRNNAGQPQSSFRPGEVLRLRMHGTVPGGEALPVTLRWIVRNAAGNPIAALGADNVQTEVGPGAWSRDLARTVPAALAPGQYTFVGELRHAGQTQQRQSAFTILPSQAPVMTVRAYMPLMSMAACDAFEPNDNRANNPSGPLGAGQTIQARICSGDPEDNYFFTTATRNQVQIRLTLPNKFVNHTSLWVYNRNDVRQGKEICTQGSVPTATFTLLCSIPATGSYVVRLYTDDGVFDELNYYTLRVDYE
jgi:predicted RecB family endonuclease